MSASIDDLGSADEIVYHYTNVDTMMKIVESASLWATSINYLNDVSEGEQFGKLVARRVPLFIQKNGVEGEDLEILEEYLRTSKPPRLNTFASRPFVASFSNDGDSLPQWRSYCPQGNGVAIGFRVECLHRAFLKTVEGYSSKKHISRITFGQVHYIDDRHDEDIDGEIVKAIKAVKRYSSKVSEDGYPFFKWAIDHAACFRKHASFRAEGESRLLVYAISEYYRFEFRPTRSSLVPYIPVLVPKYARFAKTKDAPDSRVEGTDAFIPRVVIGPTANMALTSDAVSAFLSKSSIKAEVIPSTVPFRDW